MTFSIENETNNITIHATEMEAEAVVNAESFGTEAALTKLAADWSTTRLVEIWNSLPGAAPVKKFADRKKAIARIWKAIQSLGMRPRPRTTPNPHRNPRLHRFWRKDRQPKFPRRATRARRRAGGGSCKQGGQPRDRRAGSRHGRKAAAGPGTRVRRALP